MTPSQIMRAELENMKAAQASINEIFAAGERRRQEFQQSLNSLITAIPTTQEA